MTKTSPGGPVPNATTAGTADVWGLLSQQFKLSGKNVKKKQVLDVNVIVNATGSAPFANGDLAMRLFGPKNDSVGFGVFYGQNMTNLKFDQQSPFQDCSPFDFQASDCNYTQGGINSGTGTLSGSIRIDFNQEFRGLNPKGTWTLNVWDTTSDAVTSSLGVTTLEVKTGKRFVKE